MELNDAIKQLKAHGYKTTAKRKDMLTFLLWRMVTGQRKI